MKINKSSKVHAIGVRLAGPAAITFTVFALGAPVKWLRIAPVLAALVS